VRYSILILICVAALTIVRSLSAEETSKPQFARHVVAVFSRLGCNGGACHGAVQGKNDFRLSLFGANPELDYAQIAREQAARRIDLVNPEQSLLLRKASGSIPHGGGRVTPRGSKEYEILRRWIAAGAVFQDGEHSRIVRLEVTPSERVLQTGESYHLCVEAQFADGSKEDVTTLCTFESLDAKVITIDRDAQLSAAGAGDAAIIVRYRDEPAMAMALVTRPGSEPFPEAAPHNFIDEEVLAKLRRLNIPSAELADDAAFLRRARLDVTGQLPSPDEIREFLADPSSDKRARKIDALLDEPGYAAVWTLKFCDLLGAADFGVYADGLAEQFEAPRFQAWVRARLEENLPYDEFAARILLATSREGRSLEEWASEVVALQEGYATPRSDLELYAKRKTLDAYWQRKDAVGLPGAMQIAHAFLGLRLQCAQCHRHPHDVWQQDDLLSFANFFMRVRTVGFQGDNEKKFAEEAVVFKKYEEEGKQLAEEAKKLKEGPAKELSEKARQSQQDANRLKNEINRDEQQAAQRESQASERRIQAGALPEGKSDEAQRLRTEAGDLEQQAKQLRETVAARRAELAPLEQTIAENEAMQQKVREMERRSRYVGDESAKRILHAQIVHLSSDEAAQKFASVESPLGKQSSQQFRLLGEREPLEPSANEDPREKVVEWLRRPDNPFFAKAIVNRVWAHYFGRGLIDPPDDLSPFNPASHPALLEELTQQFIANKYDLKWLHRAILLSRTYQQSSAATAPNQDDRTNYSHFYVRRLPAEVLLDAVNQATGTRDDMDMRYYHWPEGLRTVEIPYLPRNEFVTFMIEQFGRSERNSSAQCDCQRQSEPSMLQVLSLANHPQVWRKIADPVGRVAEVIKQLEAPRERIEAIYLSTLARLPEESETQACLSYLDEAESPEIGLQGVLWSLLNTREFILQH
jgi:hypothetical protein